MEKRIVLIADDDELSREVIRKNFKDIYEVLEAENGKQALDMIHNQHIDIVILDIVMPEMTGYEVLQQVKCDEKYSDMRIVVATSLQEKTERKALELGADDIVFKPYDPVVIKKRLDNLLTMQEQKRELEKALERAEKANKAKTDFLSRISHDMRTPLNGILGIAALMKDSIIGEKARDDLQQLELSGKYLLNLINDTLDVSKIEVGKLELRPDVYDGRSTINHVIDLIRPNMEEKHINFHLKADDLPFNTLYMDMGRLEQVFMNILGNAVKFTPDGGDIYATIKNISYDAKLIVDQVEIRDTGIGISKEFLPHLFEPFSQENPGSTGNTTGTGLGMTISRQIVELMGGSITAESELGKGTTFTLVLPMPIATEEQIEEWKEKTRSESSNFSLENKRILLCEDHPLNAEIARRLLEKRGMLVEHAENGRIAVELYEKSPRHYYDLILMDIRMPEMDGLDATKAIRNLDRTDAQAIPIIAMTANAYSEDILKVKEAGMDAHLGKPIVVGRLYQMIAEYLCIQRESIKRKILVVDDIDTNRAMIDAALGGDFDMYEARNGEEALEILKNHRAIDIVITDIQMPTMSGLELITRIREVPEYNHIKIIANTQFGDPEQEEEILNLGANDFVYKPTTPKIIELRVRNVMSRL